MANGGLTFTLLDYDRETGSTNLQTGAVTGVSLPGLLTQIGTLRTAIEGITVGVVSSESLYAFRTRLSNTPPADPDAQRERVWVVHYEDTTAFFDDPVNAIPNEGFGKNFTIAIPTADFSGDRLLTNSEDADLAETSIAAFVTAFEAIARSPYGGEVNVTRIQAGGRSR
jgi:hypothetical protein